MLPSVAKVALLLSAAASIPAAQAFLPCNPMPLSVVAGQGQCVRATALQGLRMDGTDEKKGKGAGGVQRRAILGGMLGAAAWTVSGCVLY